ncbi:MAG: hypothetical protein ACK5NK_08475 [Niabella sp.]
MKKNILLLSILTFIVHYVNAQCTLTTATTCLGNNTQYNYTPIKFTTTNTTIYDRRIARSGLPNEQTDEILLTAVARNAACVLVNGTLTQIDAVVHGIYWNMVSGNTEPATLGSFTIISATDPDYPNTLLWSGGGTERIFRIEVLYYLAGTYSTTTFSGGTAVNINSLQQVTDIDGDGVNDAGSVYTDPRSNYAPVPQNGGVRDDFFWTAGMSTTHYSIPTLLYTKTTRPTNNFYAPNGSDYIHQQAYSVMPTSGYTYFYSAGNDNYSFSSINGITASAATQNVVLSWANRSWLAFYYYPGNFGGVYVDLTGENNKFNTCTVTITGNVFNDANHNTLIDGTEGSTSGPAVNNNLFVYLVDASGKVVNFSKVNTDGTYTIDAYSNTSYTLKLSTTPNLQIGSSANNLSTTPPTGWSTTGENGAGNIGSGDGNPDGNLAITTGISPITNQNFGLVPINPLSANLGTINATFKDGVLNVNWTTLSEKDFNHFDIELSTDGQSFHKIGSVNSKAVNGSSTTPLDYHFSIAMNDAMKLFYILPVLFSIIAFKRRNKLLVSLSIIFAIGLGVSCNESNKETVTTNTTTKYVRITMVDEDGSKSFSKFIKIIEE